MRKNLFRQPGPPHSTYERASRRINNPERVKAAQPISKQRCYLFLVLGKSRHASFTISLGSQKGRQCAGSECQDDGKYEITKSVPFGMKSRCHYGDRYYAYAHES